MDKQYLVKIGKHELLVRVQKKGAGVFSKTIITLSNGAVLEVDNNGVPRIVTCNSGNTHEAIQLHARLTKVSIETLIEKSKRTILDFNETDVVLSKVMVMKSGERLSYKPSITISLNDIACLEM